MSDLKKATDRFQREFDAFLDRDPRRRAALPRAAFYRDVRVALRRLRAAARMSQTAVADGAERQQSEISRLENGLGDGTRLGTVLDYVAACGGRVGFVIRDRNGHVILDQSENAEAIVERVDHVLRQHAISEAEQDEILQDLRAGISVSLTKE
jgi:transcriptional regulator with XRE-family HTH domain